MYQLTLFLRILGNPQLEFEGQEIQAKTPIAETNKTKIQLIQIMTSNKWVEKMFRMWINRAPRKRLYRK